MCLYSAKSATALAVILWRMDSAAAMECNSQGLESLLAGHLDKGSTHWMGVWYVNI